MTQRHDDAHWARYNGRQEGRAVRVLCARLLALAGDGAGRTAIDLGCGAGIETRAMLESGWRVHAFDREPGTRERVLKTTRGADQRRLAVTVVDLGELRALPAADLVYAGYSLPYVHPDRFRRLWALIGASLRPDGWFAGNLFGDRDSWAGNPDETFLTGQSARDLFLGWRLLNFTEVEEDRDAFSGPKHWHVFEVIARNSRPRPD